MSKTVMSQRKDLIVGEERYIFEAIVMVENGSY
jgi:hypothetical protein